MNPESNGLDPAAIEVAIAWWVKELDGPDGLGQYNNGDPSSIAGPLMAMIAEKATPPSDTDRAAFAAYLRAELQRSIYAHGATLRVDYAPTGILARAIDAARIDASRLPWKTRMRVDPDRVTVAKGYGADDHQLWPPVPVSSDADIDPDSGVVTPRSDDPCAPNVNFGNIRFDPRSAIACADGYLDSLASLGPLAPPCTPVVSTVFVGFPVVVATKHRPATVVVQTRMRFQPQALIVAEASAANYTIESIVVGLQELLIDPVSAACFGADAIAAREHLYDNGNLITHSWIAPGQTVSLRVALAMRVHPPRLVLRGRRGRVHAVRFRPAHRRWGSGSFIASLRGQGMR